MRKQEKHDIYLGDCLEIIRRLSSSSVDLVYLDPPFFTQRQHKMSTRDRSKEYTFDDSWKSDEQYRDFLISRLQECYRILKPSGSIFFHCDKTASHISRFALDKVFSPPNFRSEIIWHYRRWSNSSRNLLPAHQTILFYSKTKDYKFHTTYTDYSATTNIDQILQKRVRDKSNKSVYARDENGDVIQNGSKKGVPLGDVWDIPFLNPKAKERTGYPTQKPILLLRRIIELTTSPGDLVLDPFCGSGTTLVAAKLLHRNATGIDISKEAVKLARERLKNPIQTESNLLKNGIQNYENADTAALSLLNGIDHLPVQRNNGIDALLRNTYRGTPIPIRIQKHGEDIIEAANALFKAGKSKNAQKMLLIATEDVPNLGFRFEMPESIILISSTAFSINKAITNLKKDEEGILHKSHKGLKKDSLNSDKSEITHSTR